MAVGRDQRFSARGNFAPEEAFSNAWRHFWFSLVVCERATSSSEERAEMLLDILQCTAQPPTATYYLVQHVNSAKAEKTDTDLKNRVGRGKDIMIV